MVMMSPVRATMKPAPADRRSSRTVTVNPVGRRREVGRLGVVVDPAKIAAVRHRARRPLAREADVPDRAARTL